MIRSSIAYQWPLTFKERANQIDVALERLRTQPIPCSVLATSVNLSLSKPLAEQRFWLWLWLADAWNPLPLGLGEAWMCFIFFNGSPVMLMGSQSREALL